MRWVVGDVQGCARELDDLLREIRYDPARDEVWSAGDIINRGPDSLAAARLWRDIGGRGVIGNHEVYALLSRSGRWPRKKDELAEFWAAPDADELAALLRALPLIAHLRAPADAGTSTGRDAWLVHAGLHPHWRDLPSLAEVVNAGAHDDDWLARDDVSFATRVRCCTVDGVRSKYDREPSGCPSPYRPWDELFRSDVLVVHGHWAWRGHYRSRNAIGLDSGCVYGGRLTAWCQDEDRVVSVPARSSPA
jgi:bis(5'-nucleosyl)-tetraphosphatase (symmetrical)